MPESQHNGGMEQIALEIDAHKRLISVDRPRVAQAYDTWFKAKGREERNSGGKSEQVFVALIRANLDMTRDQAPTNLKIPTGNSGWSNWRKGRPATMAKLPLPVCQAILAVTGEDVTPNKFLQDKPNNWSELATLGPVRFTGDDIKVDHLTFQATRPKDLYSQGGSYKSDESQRGRERRLGSVRYKLYGASIALRCDCGTATFALLADGTTSNTGEITLEEDYDAPLRYDVKAEYPKILQGRFKDITLYNGPRELMPDYTLTVSIEPSDLDVDITWSGEKSQLEHDTARTSLIKHMLRRRVIDPTSPRARHVLSSAKVTGG